MINLVISSCFLLWGGLLAYKLMRDNHFDTIVNKWELDLTNFMDLYDLNSDLNIDIDIEFKHLEPSEFNRLSKSSVGSDSLLAIGKDVPKGYDFFTMEADAGFVYFPHKHKHSKEFFYVLEGKLEFNIEDEIETLSAKDHLYIENEKFHSAVIIEDAKLIIVAKPSILMGATT